MVSFKEHLKTLMTFDEIQIVDIKGSNAGKIMRIEDDFVILETKNATLLIPFHAILSVKIRDV